jgi:hypothetical protein
MLAFNRRLGDRPISNAVGMNEGLASQIHQIVDDEPIVAFRSDGPSVTTPLRVMIPM